MVHPEGEAPQESPQFKPATSIRCHHIERVIPALIGVVEPDVLASIWAYKMYRGRHVGNDGGYFTDAFGDLDDESGVSSALKTMETAWTAYFSGLRDLPDDSYVELDMAPDWMCWGMKTGRHCTATNYQCVEDEVGEKIRDREEVESDVRGWILSDLEDHGYTLGKDYIIVPKERILYDLGGRRLDDRTQGEGKVVTFDTVVVRTGALRDAVKGRWRYIQMYF